MSISSEPHLDIFIVGGGINGCGIARDAAGRGLKVALAEMHDIGGATSSASTKLFHGGLRYLEFLEFKLVREALMEREVLLKAMPHISWPMRFVLPYDQTMTFDSETPVSRMLSRVAPWLKGRRPAWLIRLGLFTYDMLAKREVLPATTVIALPGQPEGAPLKADLVKAFEYSDVWVNDTRLVALNARDAAERGAKVMTRTRVVSANRRGGFWDIETKDAITGTTQNHRARLLINAAGPWVGDVLNGVVRSNSPDSVRLVRGSHIVTRKLFDHGKCYFFQGSDGRIVFAIPYEDDFTLIGTTEAEHSTPSERPICTADERDYLINFVNRYFKMPINVDDIVWSYSGVRPLYDDGAANATAATREYTLKLDTTEDVPLLNIYGGKITTYRRLAENALAQITDYFPHTKGDWTAGVALAGGDFEPAEFANLVQSLQSDFPFLSPSWANRLIRYYGTEARALLGSAKSSDDLGLHFGATLTETELRWLIKHEFAKTAEDVLWRRTKLGLHFDDNQTKTLEQWMAQEMRGTL